jgi:hypothetical protein
MSALYEFEKKIEAAFDALLLSSSGIATLVKGDNVEAPTLHYTTELTVGGSLPDHTVKVKTGVSEYTHYSANLTIGLSMPIVNAYGVATDWSAVVGLVRERIRDYHVSTLNASLTYHEIAFIVPAGTQTQKTDDDNMLIAMSFSIVFRIKTSSFPN